MNSKGQEYEALALKYLMKKGLVLLDKNFHTRFGEVDLVMQHDDSIVFVEVRYRTHSRYGGPLASIHEGKQRKIIKTAKIYMHQQQLWQHNMRFDVVAIQPTKTGLFRKFDIDWIPNAFLVAEVDI